MALNSRGGTCCSCCCSQITTKPTVPLHRQNSGHGCAEALPENEKTKSTASHKPDSTRRVYNGDILPCRGGHKLVDICLFGYIGTATSRHRTAAGRPVMESHSIFSLPLSLQITAFRPSWPVRAVSRNLSLRSLAAMSHISVYRVVVPNQDFSVCLRDVTLTILKCVP